MTTKDFYAEYEAEINRLSMLLVAALEPFKVVRDATLERENPMRLWNEYDHEVKEHRDAITNANSNYYRITTQLQNDYNQAKTKVYYELMAKLNPPVTSE